MLCWCRRRWRRASCPPPWRIWGTDAPRFERRKRERPKPGEALPTRLPWIAPRIGCSTHLCTSILRQAWPAPAQAWPLSMLTRLTEAEPDPLLDRNPPTTAPIDYILPMSLCIHPLHDLISSFLPEATQAPRAPSEQFHTTNQPEPFRCTLSSPESMFMSSIL